jgi:hypothetical protein
MATERESPTESIRPSPSPATMPIFSRYRGPGNITASTNGLLRPRDPTFSPQPDRPAGVPGGSTPLLTAPPIRLIARQPGQTASGDPSSSEYQAAYNSAIDLLSREASDRFLAQQIQRSRGVPRRRSTFQPPPLERVTVSLDEEAPSTRPPNPETLPSPRRITASWPPPSNPNTRVIRPSGSTAGLSCTKDPSNARSW